MNARRNITTNKPKIVIPHNNKTIKSNDENKIDMFDYRNYIVLKKIDSGSFGIINLVKNKNTNEEYAAKTSVKETKSASLSGLTREVQVLLHVSHPTIIKLRGYSDFDFNGNANATFLMDYMPNGSLLQLNKQKPPEFTNTNRQIILAGVALGMDVLFNSNIIHRDLKPANVLLDSNFWPIITDFGLSKIFDPENSMEQSMSNCGTLLYMAPEVMKSNVFDSKADVYSFGILMYEVVTGNRAFLKEIRLLRLTNYGLSTRIINGMRPKIDQSVKKGLRKLIEKCWSDNPLERPTFSELFKKLSLSESDEDDDVDDYCLENVDKKKLADYLNAVNHSNCKLNPISPLIRPKLKPKQPKITKVDLNHRPRSSLSRQKVLTALSSQRPNKDSIEFFNSLSIKKQQKNILEVIANLSETNIFLLLLNELLIYLANFDQDEDSPPSFQILSKSQQFLTKIEDDYQLHILSKMTKNLQIDNAFYNQEFINVLTQFSHVLIQLKYPSKWFNNTYTTISNISKQTGKIKASLLIRAKENSTFSFAKNGAIEFAEFDSSIRQIEGINGQGTFSDCSSLQKVSIPSSVTSLGAKSFMCCTQLFEISLPIQLKMIGRESFCLCQSLTTVRIPSGVTEIGANCFTGCSSLKSVTFENNSKLTLISPWSFSGCVSLDNLKLPSSLLSIGSCAFRGCRSLSQISLGSNLVEIGQRSFACCVKLCKITIPGNVKNIRSWAFCGCVGLEEVIFDDDANVESFGDRAFAGCSNLNTIEIPESLSAIGRDVFAGCSKLNDLDIPYSVISIGEKVL